MMPKIFIAFCVILLLFGFTESKGGRGGFSSRGSSSRGSSSGGGWFSSSRPSSSSSSGGWFSSSKPSPSPSYSSPAYKPSSYNSPSASAPSYGWNVNKPASSAPSPSYNKPASSPSYGWNVNSPSTGSLGSANSNTANSKPYGWNVGGNTQTGSKPVGPPPAYPGLGHNPVSHGSAPPAYSPSYSNPPAYNPSYSSQPAYVPRYNSNYKPSYSPSYGPSYSPSYSPSYRQHNTYNTHSSYPGYNSYPSYGSSFGSNGLGGNTYIHNNYYGSSRSSGGSGFLTNALFYGAGMHHGYMWGGRNTYRDSRPWSSEEDRRWRATTQAPYFENKVPGSESYLPAAAVVGAATAFGLASLLPLNVPQNKPLMYCNATDIAQTQIKYEGNTYSCVNNSIAISCPRTFENQTVDECLNVNRTMQCDIETSEVVHCTNGTLISKTPIFCNSTTLLNGTNVNESIPILNCYPGLLPEKLASFIPTTTTEAPITTTTERQLSIGARMHVFFLKLIGKGDVLEKKVEAKTEMTPEELEVAPFQENPNFTSDGNGTVWIPEALTIAPETTTTTTTEAPFIYAIKIPHQFENGTFGFRYEKASDYIAELFSNGATVPSMYEKIPLTSEIAKDIEKSEVTTKLDETNSTTQLPLNSTVKNAPLGQIKEESDEDY